MQIKTTTKQQGPWERLQSKRLTPQNVGRDDEHFLEEEGNTATNMEHLVNAYKVKYVFTLRPAISLSSSKEVRT